MNLVNVKRSALALFTFAFANVVFAASSISTTGLTDEISGAKESLIALFGAGLVILGIIAGWRYIKKGVNSA